MFIVTTRNTFKPESDPTAVRVEQYRHVQQGEPCLNHPMHMTKTQAHDFTLMLEHDLTTSHDIVAGRNTTYTITKD